MKCRFGVYYSHRDLSSSPSEQEPARRFAYGDPDGFSELIDKLVDASASYLIRQLQAGADVVQIFDTWAGVLPAGEFHRWCVGRCKTMDRLGSRKSRERDCRPRWRT